MGGGTEPLIVRVTSYDEATRRTYCDKTFAEVWEAMTNYIPVFFMNNETSNVRAMSPVKFAHNASTYYADLMFTSSDEYFERLEADSYDGLLYAV